MEISVIWDPKKVEFESSSRVNSISDKNIKYYENEEYSFDSIDRLLKIFIKDIDILNKKASIDIIYEGRKIGECDLREDCLYILDIKWHVAFGLRVYDIIENDTKFVSLSMGNYSLPTDS